MREAAQRLSGRQQMPTRHPAAAVQGVLMAPPGPERLADNAGSKQQHLGGGGSAGPSCERERRFGRFGRVAPRSPAAALPQILCTIGCRAPASSEFNARLRVHGPLWPLPCGWGPFKPAKPRLPHKLGRTQLTSSTIPTPCKPLLRPMARRGPFSRYAALLTLLLVAGAAGRALRQDEEASPSPEWEESPAEEEWAESPPPAESPEPESSPEGSDYSSPDPYPFVVAVMKGDAAFCSGALIAPLVSVAAVWCGRPHAAAISRRMHDLALPGPRPPSVLLLISSVALALLCQVVLTSAHCVVGSNNQTEEVWARLGWPDLKSRWVGRWGHLEVSMSCWGGWLPRQLQWVACPCMLAWLSAREGSEQQPCPRGLASGTVYRARRTMPTLCPFPPLLAAAALRWMEPRSGVWHKSLSIPLGEASCWFSSPAALP